MNQQTKFILLISSGIILVIASFAAIILLLPKNNTSAPVENTSNDSITDFESCVAKGYPILESYPSQCKTPDGRTFIQSIEAKFEILVLESRLDNQIRTKQQIIARSQKEFDEIYTKMSEGLELDQRKSPTVDFDKSIVIAIFMGEQSNGGSSVEVKNILEDSNTVTINIVNNIPGSGCMSTAVITSPYQIISIPKTDKQIKFVEQTDKIKCN